MDVVEFQVRREQHPPVGEWTVVDIVLNGIRLQEIVRDAEAPFAAAAGDVVRAGGYMGLDPADVADGHFSLGLPLSAGTTAERVRDVVLLGCTCGVRDCWPLTARVVITQEAVTWADFRSADPDWTIRLGPFTFAREQYATALDHVAEWRSR